MLQEHRPLAKTTQESFGKVNTINIFSQGRLHFGKVNSLGTLLFVSVMSTDNSTEKHRLFLLQHLPSYFTIHHLYSTAENPVLFERACNSRNSRETNLCKQLQISKQIIHTSVLLSLQKVHPDVSGTSFKCQICSTHQKAVDCKREASGILCVTNKGADLWLTIFTNTLENLLQQVSSVTLQNTIKEVTETLLSASNIRIAFDPHTNVVSKMQRVLSSHNQTSEKT